MQKKSKQNDHVLLSGSLILTLILAIGWSVYYHRSTIRSLIGAIIERPERDVNNSAPRRFPIDAKRSVMSQSKSRRDDTRSLVDRKCSDDARVRTSTTIAAQDSYNPNQPLSKLKTTRDRIYQQH